VAVTAAVHLLAGRRTLLSVAIGTPSYVVLVDLP
jgi:branched-subunit amino acid transport protein AzlD